MDYENKYKDALKRAKDVHTYYCDDREQLRKIESIFPELKKSEDERIKNRLIKLIKMSSEIGGFALHKWEADEMLAWLEKQGKEPQGKTALKLIKEEKVDNANYVSGTKSFSIDNWVVANGTHYRAKIKAFIENDMVEFEDGTFETEENLLKDYHLWTIADAKPGDVLEFGDHGRLVTGILSFVNKNTGKVDVSCLLEGDKFKVGVFYNLDTVKPHPATKEQRDVLFQKMHEAGYVWNAKKKEVKKIENFPILSNSAKTGKNWSEEDEKCIDNCCLLIGAADNCYEKTFKDDCIHYLQNLKKRMGV